MHEGNGAEINQGKNWGLEALANELITDYNEQKAELKAEKQVNEEPTENKLKATFADMVNVKETVNEI